MKVIYGLDLLPCDFAGSAVSIGMFDGVHLGHQALLSVLRSEADRRGVPAVVLTFDRHPQALIEPEKAPRCITTMRQRLKLIEQCGVDMVVVAEFNHQISNLSPEEFVEQVLVSKLRATVVVIGANFRFGRKRTGDVEQLRHFGDKNGFRVVSMEPIIYHGAKISSTRVRHMLEKGDVEAAAQLLGRPFTLTGKVVSGQGLGRKLGYPTANISVEPCQLVPADGVYAVRLLVDDKDLIGVCSIGKRPTVNGRDRTIEIYIVGFKGNIYDIEISADFCFRLRDEIRFDSIEELTQQIARDVENSIRLLADKRACV